MKTHSRVTITCMTCMGIFLWWLGPAEAARAEWKVLRQSSYGDTFSYDAAGVKHTESNTITVLTKTQSGEYLYEIDCKNKKARLLEGSGASGSGWFNVTSGEDELVYKAVCP